jgi:8-oxoguanine deaminase
VACIDRPQRGRIAVGVQADLALFPLDELRCSGVLDPIGALVACGAHRVGRVMVGGRWVVQDGAISGLDIAARIRRHNAAANSLHAA